MPRSERRSSPSAAAVQREAVERLRAKLLGSDPHSRRRYIRDFNREFRSCRRAVRWEELIVAAYRSDIVFVGDYHALRSCQWFAARLLGELARRRRRVVLAVELVFGRHQRLLDRYLGGDLGEEVFLRRIRYEQDWGYPWEGYRDLLETARRSGVSVLAADAQPRGGLGTIRARDAHAAGRIASLFERGARPVVVVLFGESHLAAGHLPLQVRLALKRAGVDARSVVIVQNVESIYWQLAEGGQEGTEAVEVSDRKFAVFNASPLAKYEAYRQTLDRWRGEAQDDGRPDMTPTVHHVIRTILRFLGINPYRKRLPGGRPGDFLIDHYPDVMPMENGRELAGILRSEGLPGETASAAGNEFDKKGCRYVAATNSIYVRSTDLLGAAEESTRFLRFALSGRLAPGDEERPRSSHLSRPAVVVEEALGFLGSKVIDPSSRPETEPRSEHPSRAPRGGASSRGLAARREGRLLGQGLYEAYHKGQLGRRFLLGLFRQDLGEPGVAGRVLADLEGRLRRPGNKRRPQEK